MTSKNTMRSVQSWYRQVSLFENLDMIFISDFEGTFIFFIRKLLQDLKLKRWFGWHYQSCVFRAWPQLLCIEWTGEYKREMKEEKLYKDGFSILNNYLWLIRNINCWKVTKTIYIELNFCWDFLSPLVG